MAPSEFMRDGCSRKHYPEWQLIISSLKLTIPVQLNISVKWCQNTAQWTICCFPSKRHYFHRLIMDIILNAFKIYQPSYSKGISTLGLLLYFVFRLLIMAGIKKKCSPT